METIFKATYKIVVFFVEISISLCSLKITHARSRFDRFVSYVLVAPFFAFRRYIVARFVYYTTISFHISQNYELTVN